MYDGDCVAANATPVQAQREQLRGTAVTLVAAGGGHDRAGMGGVRQRCNDASFENGPREKCQGRCVRRPTSEISFEHEQAAEASDHRAEEAGSRCVFDVFFSFV